jgi:hypothetical protein
MLMMARRTMLCTAHRYSELMKTKDARSSWMENLLTVDSLTMASVTHFFGGRILLQGSNIANHSLISVRFIRSLRFHFERFFIEETCYSKGNLKGNTFDTAASS